MLILLVIVYFFFFFPLVIVYIALSFQMVSYSSVLTAISKVNTVYSIKIHSMFHHILY